MSIVQSLIASYNLNRQVPLLLGHDDLPTLSVSTPTYPRLSSIYTPDVNTSIHPVMPLTHQPRVPIDIRQLINEWQRYMLLEQQPEQSLTVQDDRVEQDTTITTNTAATATQLQLQPPSNQVEQPYRRLSQILADQKQSFALEDELKSSDRQYPFPWNGRHNYRIPLFYPDIQSIDVQPLYPTVNRRSMSVNRQPLRRSPLHSRLSSDPNTPPVQVRESDLITAIDSSIDLLKTTIEEVKVASDEKNILESLRRVSAMTRDETSAYQSTISGSSIHIPSRSTISDSSNTTIINHTIPSSIDSATAVDVEDSS
jgi:hypothetical protein